MIEIRSCAGFDEMDACVELQLETWGYDDSDAIPRKAFLLAKKIGGQVIGAFDSDISSETPGSSPANPSPNLVGFAMSLPGIKQTYDGPMPYLHSHMLAVRESHRNRGIGAQLKWEQRREALSSGIRHMEWTFDPLEIKNAFLNIHRLGAISRAYHVDFYGVSSSRLQGGLPTDRLLAEWELDSSRVSEILNGHRATGYKIEERIQVPAIIDQWKASEASRNQALAVQLENRQKFRIAFSRGLAVLGFSRDADGNGIFELGPLAQIGSVSDSGVSKENRIL
jgi:predicted GNAT superfamily acetyltransferase